MQYGKSTIFKNRKALMANLTLKHTTRNLRQLHEEFLQECKYAGKLRSETIRGYLASFDLFIKLMPEANFNLLTPEFMATFFKRVETRVRILSNGQKRRGVKNSTIATYRNKLDKFFKWLRTRGYIKNDPFLGVPYPDVRYSDRKYLHREDVKKIFGALVFNIEWHSSLVKRRNVAMYTVLLNCGLRKGELIGLKLLDIDFDRKELLVRAETSKSKINRYVSLNTRVIIALKEYLEERRKGNYTTTNLWVPEMGDAGLTINGFKHLNQKVVQGSGVRFHPHQFRHTFAVNMLNTGTDVYKLKQLLGHTDIRMTAAYLRGLPTKSMQQDVEKLSFGALL